MYSLENIKKVYAELKLEFPKSKFISIVGTNGKGTTAHLLDYILRGLGYSVGLYTSPHLIDLEERIVFNGKKIDKGLLKSGLNKYKNRLTFFEALTVVALEYFEKRTPDFIILEAGLGGRLDATNIVNNELTILTSIGLDHIEILGDTLEAIALEKLAVAQKVLINGEEHLYPFIADYAKTHGLKQYSYNRDFYLKDKSLVVRDKTVSIKNIPKFLTLKEQLKNLALATFAVLYFVDFDTISMDNFFLPAHLELFRYKNKNIFVDTAHNLPAIQSILKAFTQRPVIFLSLLKDKDIESILEFLATDKVFFIPSIIFSKDRGIKKTDLIRYKKPIIKDFTEAFSYINSSQDKTFLFVGSHYFYPKLLKLLSE